MANRSYMSIWESIKLLLVFLFIDIGLSLVFMVILSGTSLYQNDFILSILTSLIALLVVLKISRRNNSISIRDKFNIRQRDITLYIPMVITILGLIIIVTYLVNYVETIIPVNDLWSEVFEESFGQGADYLEVLVLTVIVAPIIEELLFRGVILQGLLGKYTVPTSILVSSLLFALFHGNIYQFISAFLVGIFLAWIFVKTKSLFLCMLGHGLFNGFIFLADYIMQGDSASSLGTIVPLWVILIGILLIALGSYLLKRKTPPYLGYL